MDSCIPQVRTYWRKCCTYPLCAGGPTTEETPQDLASTSAGVLGRGWGWQTEDPVVIERLPQILNPQTIEQRPDVADSFQLLPLKLVCTILRPNIHLYKLDYKYTIIMRRTTYHPPLCSCTQHSQLHWPIFSTHCSLIVFAKVIFV